MELWMDLLFGNWIGLLSMITIAVTLLVGIFMFVMFMRKSKGPDEPQGTPSPN